MLLAVALVAACSEEDPGGAAAEDQGPRTAPPQTLAGGVDLEEVDPLRLLVGEGLAYGEPLPSEQAAADAYLEDPEVASVIVRRLHSRVNGRPLGRALVLTLDGSELFDESVLDAFAAAAVGSLGDGTVEEVTVAGLPVRRSTGDGVTAMGYRQGDQLMLVSGPSANDVGIVVDRQLTAIAQGAVGDPAPFTPLVRVPVGSAFVEVPTVEFQAIPPPEEEPAPEPPGLPGATAVEGRYGVVAGERRTTVWAYALGAGAYPSAESVTPALSILVSARAGGAPAEATEVLGRIVLAADGAEGSPSVRAFRHQGVVLVVEGQVPAQLDAVISAWLTELASPS